ncbi:MAG: hypothetical protein GEV11_15390 [Streptosporangiales bacterium]|nr:hypothetical protein [Streptosporangiales bacterium]
MTPRPAVRDIRSYLSDTGWQRAPHTWREASIWSHAGGHEVLVPPRDDLADAEHRVRDILYVLTTVEQRPATEIAHDIGAPLADVQTYRTFPEEDDPGFTSLTTGLRGLQGVRDVVRAAARATVEGPLPTFPRGTPWPVGELLKQVRLAAVVPEKRQVTVRVPVAGPPSAEPPPLPEDPPLGRQVTLQLYESLGAVHAAAERATPRDLTPFDMTVTAGVSANLCDALGDLADGRRHRPFAVTFRWGRGLPSGLPASTVTFTPEMGRVIGAASDRLRRVGISGDGFVMGVVEGLHDQPEDGDRWRVKIRGQLTARTGGPMGRSLWVRFDDQATYDLAITAHREHRRVRASGEFSAERGRVELVVDARGFLVL